MTDHAKRAGLYLRVSTDKQETDTQESECTAYALREALPIVSLMRDTVTGSTPWRLRRLGELINGDKGITDLIVYEYSRIGRDMVDTLEFLKHCNERGISVHVAKNKTVVRADIGGKVISTVMSLAAEIERDLLRNRTRDALTERKKKIAAEGGFISAAGNFVTRLGRPAGTSGSSKLTAHAAEIKKMTDAQVSDSAIARIFGCDRRTVAAFRIAQQEDGKK